jgi:hypothetical protein
MTVEIHTPRWRAAGSTPIVVKTDYVAVARAANGDALITVRQANGRSETIAIHEAEITVR